jgi:hypothetical protein
MTNQNIEGIIRKRVTSEREHEISCSLAFYGTEGFDDSYYGQYYALHLVFQNSTAVMT